MMQGSLWLIPILCLVGAVLNLILGALKAPKTAVTVVGVGSVGAATVAAYIALWEYLGQPYGEIIERYFTWISAGEITVNASLQLDPLSAVMTAFVTFVGFLIHVYSVGYMHSESEAGYARYFAYLNLFMFAMLLLVLASNLPLLFVGWEGVGLCSYLLIGYYYEEKWCAAAGSKAFIVNRIGDLGFLLAIFATLAVFGSVEFNEIFPTAAGDPHQYAGAATIIALLLFVGAIGKSAQIPLYVWLPDAMAGPTPVSALIHAATMVTAGVYIVARCNVFFRLSPTAMIVVAVIGGVTALFAATIGLVQNDIKKVLAYSTVSQLGYMFLAAGVGAFTIAIFHVVTHAFFKACLFLGSGSVIHANSGEQDMTRMGGLRKYMPTTYWTFLVATLAIAGVPVFAGFFSKDEILARAFAAAATDLNGFGDIYRVLWYLAVGGALLTAFYMFRAVYMTFHGAFRGGAEAEHHLHESPRTMTVPLIALGFLSIIGGFIGFPGQLFHKTGWNLIEGFLHPVILPLGQAHAAAEATEWSPSRSRSWSSGG
jgi:NADH-quinone oxidoreductase subunit L